MNIFEKIMDRIYWTIVAIAVVIIVSIVWLFDLIAPEWTDLQMENFFKKPVSDPNTEYAEFCKRHPILGWILKWPLHLLSM